jgi:energy-coupling factor transporter ATP-binding protein EcfA2
MAKRALVATMSRRKHVEAWKEWAGQPEAKGEGVFWLNLEVPERWREEVQKLAQQGEAEFWLKHGRKIVVKADLLDVRWATSKEGISLPEEWKNLWTPDPEKLAPTWLLLRNLQIVDEPYQPPSERQRPTQSAFGVVLLEPLESTEPKEVKPALLRGLVRDFGYWLQGPKGDLNFKERKEKIERYQEKLRDEKAIDALEEQDVRTLLQGLWALRFLGTEKAKKAFVDNILRQNGLDKLKEWLKDMVHRGERGLGARDFDDLLEGVNGIGSSILSELLCLRFPDRYWIWNKVTEGAAEELRKIGASQFRPVKGTNGQQYFAWKSLLDEICEALMETQSQLPDETREALREMPYFVADSFCNWLVHERKVWRIAPGEGGEWWNECRENGCIVIGWNEAAEKTLQNDFSQLSKDKLKDLFKQVYGGKRGSGGWSQVWDFVHEIQPGDIIVAKSGTKEILGIGIVTSDCIPPKDSAHPFESDDKHKLHYTHARKVDWRITESVQVDFGLGGQTVVRERRWDDIVKAYWAKGIDVYERLWGSGDSPPSDTDPPLVRYFKAKGFQFTKEQVVAFYAALKTKGFVILSGLSGTGKTKLAQLFAELFPLTQIELTVQPNMLRDKRVLIPRKYQEFLPDFRRELRVEVTAEGVKETCLLKRWKHPNDCTRFLVLKGAVAGWFVNNLKAGDRFFLLLGYDEKNNLRITISKVQPDGCFLSVRPDWRDSKPLLGYYNPLTKRYESTPLLEFLLRAARDYKQNKSNAQPYFVILDEMNLAHVEYYFADFLSVLESGRDKEGWTKEALRLHSFRESILDQDGYPVPPELRLPPNLYIMGTVNIDETTYMFSPKVLDRAFTLEFREVDFSNYPPEGVNEEEARRIAEQIRENGEILADLRNGGKFYAVVADKEKVKEALQKLGGKKTELEKLNRTLQPYDLHFGYRVLDEIALFVQNATQAPDDVGKLDKNEEMAKDKALDYAVLMKVLPKFHGPRQKLEKPLWQVLNWCLEEEVSDGSVSPQKVWKQITGEEKQPSGDDIAAQLRDWNSIVGKFRYPNTAKKVLQMLRQLYETGFASFAQ